MDGEIEKRIRAARAYAGYSQPQLAERIGVGRVRVTDIEMGRVPATENELLLIARHCKVPDEFFTAPWSRLGEATKYERAIEYVLSAREQAAEQPAIEIGPPPPIPPLPEGGLPTPTSTPATGRQQARSARGKSRPR